MTYYDDGWARVLHGDALETLRQLPAESANVCVTSPPYWGLRDYGVEGQLGLEPTPEEYVCRMVEVFREVRRVLRDDGTLWLNIGDSYAGSGKGPEGNLNLGESFRHLDGATKPYRSGTCKPKDLVGIPWMLAFALRNDGWYLRSDIIWAKPNPMPESVTDRPTKAHEYLFLLSKRERYYWNGDAIAEPASYPEGPGNVKPAKGVGEGEFFRTREGLERIGPRETRNKRTVWTIATEPYPEAHFATFPTALVTPCVLAGCPEGGTVLDPFAGSGTTLQVAKELGRRSIGIELNAEYLALIEKRMRAIPTPMEFSR